MPVSVPAARCFASRSADLVISSLATAQDNPMPRCAVSIASAIPKPWAQRCSRKLIVASQSITAPDRAATWAAAYTRRDVGGG